MSNLKTNLVLLILLITTGNILTVLGLIFLTMIYLIKYIIEIKIEEDKIKELEK